MEPTPPGDDLLRALGVAAPVFLGGRVRKHWRVRRSEEACVLTRCGGPEASILYEARALEAVSRMGWPVPRPLGDPVFREEWWWTLAPLLPGAPLVSPDEPARRGRLLAEFHASIRTLPSLGERPGFRRAERVLEDPRIDAILGAASCSMPKEAAIVRWHLDRARRRLDGIDLAARQGQLVHGDFATWNLHYTEGGLSGILDFELAHEDHRVAEFAHAWRGKYDAVVQAYDEILPLEPVEWAILTPIWWTFLADLWCRSFESGTPDDGWAVAKLLQRSPLMGPDRDPYPL